MRRLIMTSCLLLLSFCPTVHAGDKPLLDSEAARTSYSIGYQAVEDARRLGAEPDLPALLRGMLDAIAGSTPLLGTDERQAALATLSLPEAASGVKQELPQLHKDQTFMATYAKKPGVTTLPSGLQYRVIQPGSGEKPALEDSVTVHYRGSLVDGGEFDSSYAEDKPESYRVSEVMPGWTEALQLMPEGAVWELVIPPRLAFGKRGPLENRTLIYRLELLSVIRSKANPRESGATAGSE
jgi:FKBP-type peptidyl-prolyl cis-trans isomerase FklB